jgi:carbamoyltransferase
MIVLGLNHGEINSSAAIVKDGEVIAGSPEERFTRQKKTKVFPSNSVRYCLNKLDIKINDCDYIAQAWNPHATLNKYNPIISSFRNKREDYFYSIPDHLFNLLDDRKPKDWSVMHFEDDILPPIYYVQHHRAHAANSFYLSPYETAAVLVVDWRGEFETATMYAGKQNKLELLDSQEMPHSLGMLYSTFTEFLGYLPDSDEWKVMALSAFDIDYQDEYEKIKSTIQLLDNGFFEMDQTYYKGALLDQPFLYTQKLVELLGGRIGIKGEIADDWHKRIACAMQKISEDIALHMLEKLYEKTQCENLVLGGGFFMNSVFNGKISELTPFKNVYIPYAPTDAGNSIGAALYVAHHIHDCKRKIQYNSSLIGYSPKSEDIRATLKRRHLQYTELDDREMAIAELISQGNIVAVCNGNMEFGERALGNRSILADPRKVETKTKINSIIKYRENYRPFAPVTLQSEVSKYFEVDQDFTANHMEKVVMMKKEFRSQLEAVVHVDGSGRVQTINYETNPEFSRLIEKVRELTGLPFVLNTSFNINGEPIVQSPDDALNTFFNSGLEHLFIGNFYITKGVGITEPNK